MSRLLKFVEEQEVRRDERSSSRRTAGKWSLLPVSLFSRSLAILLLPLVLLQLIVGLVFFQRHYLRVTEQLSEGVALELGLAVRQAELSDDPDQARERLAVLSDTLRLAISVDPDAPGPLPESRRGAFDATGGRIIATLSGSIAQPISVDLLSDSRDARIAIATDAGRIDARIPRSRLSVSNPHQLLVLMLLASLILGAISVLFLRNQVKPIRKLAEAAEAFGKGRALSFRPSGAEEVRRAGTAFVAMRSRLERQIDQRTQMLSGVSHDLRTPLTRMKLTIALMTPTAESRDIEADINQMERMLAEFLAFAQGDVHEQTSPTDPFELADRVAESVRRLGGTVIRKNHSSATGPQIVDLRASSVQRALQNLVNNAARHGDIVELMVNLSQKNVEFKVEDDGPGIPPEQQAKAISPFVRLDSARSQNTEGHVGLGLSIAMDIARSHGGALELDRSPKLGGLRANLIVPR
jgi:two-component system osmolarity sensor histidine kinase EnvZ